VTENGREQARLERLRGSVAKLRSRGGKGHTERWLMIAGGGGVVVGLFAIILGWVGASRTPYVFEQNPYLISGGLFGLGLAVVGGLAYFAYWMTRNMQETRVQAERVTKALTQIEKLLAAGAGARSNGGAVRSGNGFVATAKGSMYHRPDCLVVAGRDDLHYVMATDGLEPCRICEPVASV
jgi:hypothetical protein